MTFLRESSRKMSKWPLQSLLLSTHFHFVLAWSSTVCMYHCRRLMGYKCTTPVLYWTVFIEQWSTVNCHFKFRKYELLCISCGEMLKPEVTIIKKIKRHNCRQDKLMRNIIGKQKACSHIGTILKGGAYMFTGKPGTKWPLEWNKTTDNGTKPIDDSHFVSLRRQCLVFNCTLPKTSPREQI